jgi:hypothetical protein
MVERIVERFFHESTQAPGPGTGISGRPSAYSVSAALGANTGLRGGQSENSPRSASEALSEHIVASPLDKQ